MSKNARLTGLGSVGLSELVTFCRREPRIAICNVRKLWHFYLKNLVPEVLTNGSSEYVRFVIVGRPRTGSNFLRTSLMSHSRIIVFGDVFRKYSAIHWGIPFYPQSKSMLSLIQSDPVGFLEREIFSEFPRYVSAVGFKTLYPHTRNKNWGRVQTYLGSQRSIKVIHVKRRNILKAHFSLERVMRGKGTWIDVSGAGEDNEPVFLDYEDCLRAFVDTRELEARYDTFFENHPKIDVLYEDLSSNYENEMRRIQEFLGVDYEAVKPLTYKQLRQPLSRAIANYSELREKFEGTPWEEFFEEDQEDTVPR